MKSLNVRLTSEDVKAVDTLRRAGENVSEIARAALRSAAERARPPKPRTKADVLKILAELDAKYPGPPPEYVQLGIDITDRKQTRAYLKERQERKAKRRGR